MRTGVLVVDDEPGMRETLVDILNDAGYQVWAAVNGDEAPSHVEAQAVDIVLMDIRMPGRDGVAVLQEMGPAPPQVIMMTAYAVEERLRQAVADAFALVHKPFAVGHLLELVAEAASTASDPCQKFADEVGEA